MSRRIPRAVSMHMAQNAFARCAEKVNTRKNLTLNRQAVGEVVSYCTMIAANDTLDFDRDKQERLCTEMNHRAEVYTVEMSAYGQPKAREKLRERTAPMLDKPFVLPAGQYPRKQREKDALAERRAAAVRRLRVCPVQGLSSRQNFDGTERRRAKCRQKKRK